MNTGEEYSAVHSTQELERSIIEGEGLYLREIWNNEYSPITPQQATEILDQWRAVGFRNTAVGEGARLMVYVKTKRQESDGLNQEEVK